MQENQPIPRGRKRPEPLPVAVAYGPGAGRTIPRPGAGIDGYERPFNGE